MTEFLMSGISVTFNSESWKGVELKDGRGCEYERIGEKFNHTVILSYIAAI